MGVSYPSSPGPLHPVPGRRATDLNCRLLAKTGARPAGKQRTEVRGESERLHGWSPMYFAAGATGAASALCLHFLREPVTARSGCGAHGLGWTPALQPRCHRIGGIRVYRVIFLHIGLVLATGLAPAAPDTLKLRVREAAVLRRPSSG
jgi:hypothetical protein